MDNTPKQKRLEVRKARRRAFDESAGAIECMDLQELFGDEVEDIGDVALEAAKEYVVSVLRRKALSYE